MHFNIKWRLIYLTFGILAFLIAYSSGAAIDMNKREAENLKLQFTNQIKDIDQNGIFINNIKIALGMFIPVFGDGLGIFTGFSTGMVVSAITKTSLITLPPWIVLITPFGIMEVFVYGLAMSRSGIMVYQLAKKKPWREYVIPMLVEVGIAVILLLTAALIEWQMVKHYDSLHSSPHITKFR